MKRVFEDRAREIGASEHQIAALQYTDRLYVFEEGDLYYVRGAYYCEDIDREELLAFLQKLYKDQPYVQTCYEKDHRKPQEQNLVAEFFKILIIDHPVQAWCLFMCLFILCIYIPKVIEVIIGCIKDPELWTLMWK